MLWKVVALGDITNPEDDQPYLTFTVPWKLACKIRQIIADDFEFSRVLICNSWSEHHWTRSKPVKEDCYGRFVDQFAKPLGSRALQRNHAVLGMLGELGELADAWKKHWIYSQPLDLGNILEELGDFAFYLQLYYNNSDRVPEKINLYYPPLSDLEVVTKLTQLSKPETNLWQPLASLAYNFGFTLKQVKAANMRKLYKRYPEKRYTDKHAKARLDKEPV